MNLPWWAWILVGLWCFPGVYSAFALLLQKPIGGLDIDGEPYPPVPVVRQIILFPLIVVLLMIVWPWVLLSEYRGSRR